MAEPQQPNPAPKSGRNREALRQSEERYRMLVDSLSDYAVFMLDPQGTVISWNLGAERYKGYRPEEIIGRSFTSFYTPEDLASGRPQRLLEAALALGHVEDEGWRVRKDGTRFWANVVLTAMRDQTGKLIGFSKVTRDLTERKLAEDQRRQFKLLIENVTDYAIIMLTPEGRVSSWNRGAQALKGYSEAEAIGMPYEQFFLPEDVEAGKPRFLLGQAIAHGHYEDEGWRRRKDGSRFWALSVITAVYDEAGTFIGYGKVTRDLTDRKRMEELSAEKARLKASNQLKSEFLANMSHELRTPLNSIIGYTELVLTDDQLPLDELNAGNLQTVLRNARHLLELINEILDFSKIEAGQSTVHPGPFDPRQTLLTAVSAGRPLAEQKGLALEVHVEPGIELVVSDETKVRQILFNLVSNALKFTNEGRVDVHLAPLDEQTWQVRVSDSGIGVAPEHHELIFQEFRQVDASSTRERGGTGLGLAISRKLAELLGGTLTVESAVGRGSVFTLRLPRQLMSPEIPAPEVGLPVAPDGRPIVLAIDDEPEALRLIAENLRHSPYHVVTASSVASGLQLARELHPAAITLDVLMPGVDGWMALRRLKEEPATADIPVVMLSFLENRALAQSLGAAEYLAKPLQRGDLLAALGRVAPLPAAKEAP